MNNLTEIGDEDRKTTENFSLKNNRITSTLSPNPNPNPKLNQIKEQYEKNTKFENSETSITGSTLFKKIFNSKSRVALFIIAIVLYFLRETAKLLLIFSLGNFVFQYSADKETSIKNLPDQVIQRGIQLLITLSVVFILTSIGPMIIKLTVSKRISKKIYHILMKSLVESELCHCSPTLPLYIYDLRIQPLIEVFDMQLPKEMDTFLSSLSRIIAFVILTAFYSNPLISIVFPIIALINVYYIKKAKGKLQNFSRAEAILKNKYVMTLGSIIRNGLNIIHAGQYEAYMKIKLDFLMERWSVISWLKNGVFGLAKLKSGLISSFFCSVAVWVSCIFFQVKDTWIEKWGVLYEYDSGLASSCTLFILVLLIIRSFLNLSKTAIEIELIFEQAYQALQSTQYKDQNELHKEDANKHRGNSDDFHLLNMTLNASFNETSNIKYLDKKGKMAKQKIVNNMPEGIQSTFYSSQARYTFKTLYHNQLDINWKLQPNAHTFNTFLQFSNFSLLAQASSNKNIMNKNNLLETLMKPVLSIKRLVIPAQQKVAIVSDSETPISTLFDAILRVPQLMEGLVKLNNINLDDMSSNDVKKLRSQIFYVGKDIPIFSQDLKTNINPEYQEKDLGSKEYLKIFDILRKFAQFGKKLDSMGLNLKIKSNQQVTDNQDLNKNSKNKQYLETIGKRGKAERNTFQSITGAPAKKTTFRISFRELKTFGYVDESLGGGYVLTARERTAVAMSRLFLEGVNKSLILIDKLDARLDDEGVKNFGEMVSSQNNSYNRALFNKNGVVDAEAMKEDNQRKNENNFLEKIDDYDHSELDISTVLMICDKVCTSFYFDRVLVFSNGRLVEDGNPVEMQTKTGSIYNQMLCKEKGCLNN